MRRKGLSLMIAAGLCLGTASLLSPCGHAAASMVMDVSSVTISGNQQWSESMIRRMVPVLRESKIDVAELSRELQLVNDTNAAELTADFVRQQDGHYHLTVAVKENQAAHVAVNVNNAGDDYTGDWRMSTSYTNSNLTGRADNLGVAFVTSPGHWDDVKQAALVYRALLPQAGDSAYFTYSYSDVDLGQIANFSGLGISATGRGQTVGAHYQHNFQYTQARKNFLDFGIDYKHYKNAQDYDYAGSRLLHDGVDFEVTTASVSYADILRRPSDFFAWSLGYTGNINGNEDKFNAYRYGSDKQFNLIKASFNYQYRLPANWIVGLRMNGQYTKSNVVTTEQIGAGGSTSIRGFKERVASADKGYVGSFEVYTPEFAKHQRFVFFNDFGRLVNNHSYNGELTGETLASCGLGYLYLDKENGWFGTLSYAKIYDDLDSCQSHAHRPWQVSLTKPF
ncbi:MAG: ShlB/FhaC/HecB family hemolysin secretion/activation protein [Selenomonas bovis]|nr:ShlB/FhaC/HecB family hemolysin secretion/activation protein [Selenomonas bovis]